MAAFLAFFVGPAGTLLAALVVCISVVLLVGHHAASLGDLHIYIALLALSSEGLSDFANLSRLEGVGEYDFEDYEQISELIGLLVVGHAVSLHCLDIVGLDNFTRTVLNS